MANRVVMAQPVILYNHKSGMDDVPTEAVLTLAEDERWIRLDYMNLNCAEEGEKMSYPAALTFLERSGKEHLAIDNPVTVAHLDHIEQIIPIWNNKKIMITAGDIESAMIERQLKFMMDKSIGIEKNTIRFMFDKGNYGDSGNSEMLFVDSRLTGLGWQTVCECGNLYTYLLQYIKFTRNRNLLIDIELESVEPGFEKMFADLRWPFDDRMISWNNENMVHRSIILSFEGDTNEYRLTNDHDEDEDIDMDDLLSDSQGYGSDDI